MIVGLLGNKRSGKDTAADYLCENHNFVKYSFADPLKKACQEIFVLSDEQLYGTETDKETVDERWNASARTILQRVGTEMFRQQLTTIFPEMEEIGKNIWVYRFKLWYQKFKKENPTKNVILADVRFDNEAQVVRDLGGVVVKIERPCKKTKDAHKSEAGIDSIDYDVKLVNDGTLEEYIKKVESIML